MIENVANATLESGRAVGDLLREEPQRRPPVAQEENSTLNVTDTAEFTVEALQLSQSVQPAGSGQEQQETGQNNQTDNQQGTDNPPRFLDIRA